MSETFASLSALEQELTFSSFSRADALRLGLLINDVVVYRYFQDGARPDSELWLERKRNAVELMQMGSLCFGCMLSESGESLEDRKLHADDFAPGGGGMPIVLAGTGMIGSVCVSGEPNHLDDQEIVVKAEKNG